jgi:hypothetical protein
LHTMEAKDLENVERRREISRKICRRREEGLIHEFLFSLFFVNLTLSILC